MSEFLTSIYYCFFYLITFLILFFAKYKGDFSFKKINPVTFFLLMYILRNHVGLIFLYFNQSSFKQLRDIDLNAVVMIAAINTLLVFFFYLLSISKVYRSWDLNLNNINPKLIPLPSNIGMLFIIFLLVLLYLFAFKRIMDGSALLTLFQTGDASAARDARLALYSTGAHVFGVRLQYLNLVFFIYEFLALYILILAVMYRTKFYYMISTLFFLGLVLWHLSNTSKGYIAIIFFYVYLIYCVLFNSSQFQFKKALKLGIPLVLFAAFLAYLFMGNSKIYFFYPIERFLVGNLLPQYIIFSYFDVENMLLGSSVPGWYTLNNHEQFLIAEWNWRYMHNRMNTSLSYNNPSSLVAEFFANFNFFGVLFFSVFFAYLMIVTKILIRFTYKPIRIVSFIYLTFYFSKYSVKEFLPAVFDYRLFFTIIISSLIIYVVTKKRAVYD